MPRSFMDGQEQLGCLLWRIGELVSTEKDYARYQLALEQSECSL